MSSVTDIKAIAVDGGGTRCRIACVTLNGVSTVVVGAANAFSDFAGTVRVINEGLEELAQQLKLPVTELAAAPAYLGLAGVVDRDIAARLKQALPFSRVKIEDDRPSALRAALGAGDGIVAHCGTGSFFAAQNNKVMRFVGGWGPVLDDIASARWMGCKALSMSLYADDGLINHSPLTQHLLSSYKSTGEIVEIAARSTSSELGQLAQVVTEYEQQQDENAQHILQTGAALIADTVTKLGWKGEAICLTGGVGPLYQPYLPGHMQSCVSKAYGVPLDGAIELAHEFASESDRL